MPASFVFAIYVSVCFDRYAFFQINAGMQEFATGAPTELECQDTCIADTNCGGFEYNRYPIFHKTHMKSKQNCPDGRVDPQGTTDIRW